MNNNLFKILSLYCEYEIYDFKKSDIFFKLQDLIGKLNYSLVCEYGKALDNKKTENMYLGIQILDDKNEEIEIFDEGFLIASTLLVLADKKHRYKFFSWKDEEFIEDLNWLIMELEKIKNKK